MLFVLNNGERKKTGGIFWPNNVIESLRQECYLSNISIPSICITELQFMQLISLYCPRGFYFGTLSVQGNKEYGYWCIDDEKTNLETLHTDY